MGLKNKNKFFYNRISHKYGITNKIKIYFDEICFILLQNK
jgi:hypothetical protein